MSQENAKSESELIRRLRQELMPSPLRAAAPGAARLPADFVDDMAALGGADGLLWTVDMLMDGVDFESGHHPWGDIGRKAMAVNLSDCAAMATRPIAALCAVALSDSLSMDDAVELIRGAHEFGLRFGCPVVGGDTNSWTQPTAISITVAAKPEEGRSAVRRDGARMGDRVYVSGRVGGSLLGRHMLCEPRIDLALELNRRLEPHAMIDISDGLALDLWRILEASGCGATLDGEAVDAVIHADAHLMSQHDGRPARAHALHDGEDFELIVVLPPNVERSDAVGFGLLPIGEIDCPAGLHLREADGRVCPVERSGWEHFR